MNKWFERCAIAALVAFVLVVLIGQASVWRKCSADGGVTVRGVFGLVCIK